MLNGFGAEILIVPPDGGFPSLAGEAGEWRIEGSLRFVREKSPDGVWAAQKPVMRATSVILAGWIFDLYFLPCLSYEFLVKLHAGGDNASYDRSRWDRLFSAGSLYHQATGKLTAASRHAIREGLAQPIVIDNCALTPAAR